jgi:hypothetical protein
MRKVSIFEEVPEAKFVCTHAEKERRIYEEILDLISAS